MINNLKCWYNGNITKLQDVNVSILDFGFIHCDATYDVMKSKNGKILFYDKHLNRFKGSCKKFGFTLDFDIKKIATDLLELNDINDAFIWVISWRGTPPSGSPRDMSGPQHTVIYVKPYYGIKNDYVNLVVDHHHRRTPDECYGQQYKNFAWIELTLSQKYADMNSADSAIILSKEGFITEGPGFGICFVTDNGEVLTPKKDVLNSITIEVVEDICKEQNIEFKRKDMYIAEGLSAKECFICSTSGGITLVNMLEDTTYSHELSKKLMYEYSSRF